MQEQQEKIPNGQRGADSAGPTARGRQRRAGPDVRPLSARSSTCLNRSLSRAVTPEERLARAVALPHAQEDEDDRLVDAGDDHQGAEYRQTVVQEHLALHLCLF